MKRILVEALLFCVLSNVKQGNSECQYFSRQKYTEDYGWQNMEMASCFFQVLPKNSDVSLENGRQDVDQVDIKLTSGDDVNLTHLDLGEFPKLERLDLSKNRILNLNDFCFFHFSNLEVLNINENKLTVLPENIFVPIPQLKEVNISYNRLTQLPNFDSLKKLEILDLRENQLLSVSYVVWPISLKYIYLGGNKLSEIPNFCAFNLNLIYLDISKNNLKEFKHGIVDCMIKLETLRVSFNAFQDISVSWPNSLKNIDLGGNNLSEIPDFCKSNLSNLMYLDISKNNLKQFKHGVFDCMISLQMLNISFNAFEDIPVYVYQQLRSLTKFYIDNNQISNFDINSLFNVTMVRKITFHAKNSHVPLDVQNVYQVDVELSSDRSVNLANLNLGEFPRLGKLDLSKNRILNLTDLCFFHFSNFEVLNINENNLTILPRNIFLPNPQLREVNISYNRLTQLPNFASLEKLEILDLRENQLLSASYVIWPNSLKNIYLGGNKLSEIPNFCTSNLTNLIYLDISKNNLKQFKHGVLDCMIKLQTLNVSFNALQDIPVYVYHQLISLTQFYIDNNQISNLDVNSLFKTAAVQEITFHNNMWHCDQLVLMLQVLKLHKIYVPYKGFQNGTNIHGIRCFEEETPQPQTNISDQDFRNTFMYKFFNKDFQKSNFFSYLENLRNAKQPEAENVDVDEKFKDSAIFRYFNDDFQKSNLFKYLESLKKPQVIVQRISDNGSVSQVEKLVSALEPRRETTEINYSGLLVAIIILLIIMIVLHLYVNVGNKLFRTGPRIRQQTELLENNL